MLYTSFCTLHPGQFALERFIAIASDTQAGMDYADHYLFDETGNYKPAPAIVCQQGRLRDDFDFGSIWLYNTTKLNRVS